ncbi:hypothetical protein NVV95_03910 [Herbiconiux sp. CPCC 205716]|uniref:Siderophore-interacting protein n=1 Tax=Herbiconiux gentiana TaxID=2970912 RepID=A0ABT2GBW0_9MICO|nr:hypothetical protein [Herbiconiux gentiana]MCS5713694.1 hypothetical protein [Herbiconiux gentiana]
MGAEPAALRELRLALALADRPALEAVLDGSVGLVADRGRAATPVRGRVPVARVLLGELDGAELHAHSVNGQSGLVARRGGRVVAVVLAEVEHDSVVRVWLVTASAKLARWW